MREVRVCKKDEIAHGQRRIIIDDGLEIGVFNWEGQFYAYENLCLHQGGPACEGLIMHAVETVLAKDGTVIKQQFVLEKPHFVCPWHGYEYELKTGRCVANPRISLRRFPVIEKEDHLYIVVESKAS